MPQYTRIEITEKNFVVFLNISVHLTGFDRDELLATGMHEQYYYTIMKEPDQETVRAFFEAASLLFEQYNGGTLIQRFGTDLIPTDRYKGLAKNIILLWYTGIWGGQMISAASFTEGLIWKAARTHPAGAKQPGYASWADPPL